MLDFQERVNNKVQYNHDNLKLAKSLRFNMTKEEVKLWNILRAKRFHNLKFKRQVLVGDYIVDFLCADLMLVIELDGGQHNMDKNIVLDKQRTEYLEQQGYTVLRFWNSDVWNNIEGVCAIIEEHI